MREKETPINFIFADYKLRYGDDVPGDDVVLEVVTVLDLLLWKVCLASATYGRLSSMNA